MINIPSREGNKQITGSALQSVRRQVHKYVLLTRWL